MYEAKLLGNIDDGKALDEAVCGMGHHGFLNDYKSGWLAGGHTSCFHIGGCSSQPSHLIQHILPWIGKK